MGKTFALVASLAFLASLAPPAAAHTISCSTDPCATTACTNTTAEAHAYGSEHAWTEAKVGGFTAADSGGGHQHSDASGTSGPVSAWAKAKEDWSLDEDESSCTAPGNMALSLDLATGMVRLETPVSVACVTDGRITQTGSVSGRLFATPEGFVLYDAERGAGLVLDSLDMVFDGTTLDALAPVDASTLLPTNAYVAVDLVDGGDDGGDGCHVRLFG